MKKYNEMEFTELLQDEEFIAIVEKYNQPEELKLKLIEKYGEFSKELSNAADFIRLSKSDKITVDPNFIEESWKNVLSKSKVYKLPTENRNLHLRWFSAAAVALLIVATSLMIFLRKEETTLQQFADSQTGKSDKAIVILSDGTTHQLGDNEMHIEYSNDGEAIALKKSEGEVEKLTNIKDENKSLINQIIVPYGQTHRVTLSDGTRVHLNSGSSMVFTAEFSGKIREVFLRGEGYFDVARMDDKPFVVKTDYMDIKVLGTSFNVSAYKDEKLVSAVLVSGSVSVEQKTKSKVNSQHILKPGQGCFVSTENLQSTVNEVDLNYYIAWTHGMFEFKDQTLLDVVRRIKKYYNQTIQIEGEQLAGTLISGKLVLNNDMEQVMNYLTMALDAKYIQNDEMKYIISSR